jgi:hypothetical protein
VSGAELTQLIGTVHRVVPAFSGGGKPYFSLGAELRLRLVEQRTFRNGTVYLRHARPG